MDPNFFNEIVKKEFKTKFHKISQNLSNILFMAIKDLLLPLEIHLKEMDPEDNIKMIS
jgi:hypothetical protein